LKGLFVTQKVIQRKEGQLDSEVREMSSLICPRRGAVYQDISSELSTVKIEREESGRRIKSKKNHGNKDVLGICGGARLKNGGKKKQLFPLIEEWKLEGAGSRERHDSA